MLLFVDLPSWSIIFTLLANPDGGKISPTVQTFRLQGKCQGVHPGVILTAFVDDCMPGTYDIATAWGSLRSAEGPIFFEFLNIYI